MSFVSSPARPKREHGKRYKEEKPGRSFFLKNKFSSFVCSRSGTYYALFLIVCIELWLRFEPQIRSTRFAIIFLFIIATTERKVRFCVKLVDHFLTK